MPRQHASPSPSPTPYSRPLSSYHLSPSAHFPPPHLSFLSSYSLPLSSFLLVHLLFSPVPFLLSFPSPSFLLPLSPHFHPTFSSPIPSLLSPSFLLPLSSSFSYYSFPPTSPLSTYHLHPFFPSYPSSPPHLFPLLSLSPPPLYSSYPFPPPLFSSYPFSPFSSSLLPPSSFTLNAKKIHADRSLPLRPPPSPPICHGLHRTPIHHFPTTASAPWISM